jgi:DNA-binding MarR family transcriptional regulator
MKKIDAPKLSVCHCLNLRRAGQAVTAQYDQFLEPCEITIGQYSLMNFIKNLKQVSVSRLAKEMRLARTTLVRNIKPLEDRGLVIDVAEQGRSRQLKLTDSGYQLFAEATLLWEQAQSKFEQLLGKEQLEKLNKILLVVAEME